MVTIVKEQSPWAPLIEGLGQGMQSYGKMRQESLKKDSVIKGLIASGKSREEAEAIFHAHPLVAKEIMRDARMRNNPYESEYTQEQSAPSFMDAQQQQPQYQPQEQSSVIEAMQQMAPQQQQQQPQFPTNYSELVDLQRNNLAQKLMGLGGQQQPQGMLNQQPQQPQQVPQVQPVKEFESSPIFAEIDAYRSKADVNRRNADKAVRLGDKLSADNFANKAKSYEKAIETKEASLLKEHQVAAPIVQKVLDQGAAAEESMDLTEKQRDLVLKGGLSHPIVASVGKYLDRHLGKGIGDIIRSGDTQELNKLTAKRFENVRDVMGGVPRGNSMIEMYLDGFVKDTNSKDAMVNILKLTDLQDIKKIWKSNLAQEIVKENRDYNPRAFSRQLSVLEKKRKPQLGKMIEDHLFGVGKEEIQATGKITPSAISGLEGGQTAGKQQQFNPTSFGTTANVPNGMVAMVNGQKAINRNGQWVPYGG